MTRKFKFIKWLLRLVLLSSFIALWIFFVAIIFIPMNFCIRLPTMSVLVVFWNQYKSTCSPLILNICNKKININWYIMTPLNPQPWFNNSDALNELENDGDSQVVKKQQKKGRWNHSAQKKQEQQQSWGPCFNRLLSQSMRITKGGVSLQVDIQSTWDLDVDCIMSLAIRLPLLLCNKPAHQSELFPLRIELNPPHRGKRIQLDSCFSVNILTTIS
jgi:hypothetical protein